MGPLHGMPQAIKDLPPTKGIRDHAGLADLQGRGPDRRRAVRRAHAQRRRHHHRQDQRAGVRPRLADLQPGVRPDAQRLRPDARRPADRAAARRVALALRMLPVADGSDHGGSLRNPAAFNNVLGFRTSYGRVPHHHEDLFLTGLSVKGPMARTVEDLQMLLSVQAGYDDRVPLSIARSAYICGRVAEVRRQGQAHRLARRVRQPADGGGRARALPRGAAHARKHGLHRRGGDAGLRRGNDLEGVAGACVPGWRAQSCVRCTTIRQTRKLLKPEAQWEVEEGYKISAYDLSAASACATRGTTSVRELFQRYDYLTMPSASVFPFPVDTHWPQEIAGQKMDTYHRWMQVVIPVTMSGCPSLGVPVGFNAAGPADGHADDRQDARRARDPATRQRLRGSDGWTKKVLPPLLTGVT